MARARRGYALKQFPTPGRATASINARPEFLFERGSQDGGPSSTPQERDLITTLLDRLNKTEGQPKDPEAETLIQETVTARPDASYSLVQTVLIQDLSPTQCAE